MASHATSPPPASQPPEVIDLTEDSPPTSPAYSPAWAGGVDSSPAYGHADSYGSPPVSPAYGHADGDDSLPASPAYVYGPGEPRYSPASSPAYGAPPPPEYNPTGPAYSPTSPASSPRRGGLAPLAAAAQQAEEGAHACVGCWTRPPSMLLLPCLHLSLCAACAPKTNWRANGCPMCRADVDSVIGPVFLP